jgi:probable DNA metabolism protein
MDYLYDGSFDGFLCCVFLHYYGEKAGAVHPAEGYQGDALTPCRAVETDEDRADRVCRAIESKISAHDAKRVYLVFRSSAPGKETKLLRYIRLGFKEGAKVGLMYGNPIVFDVLRAERQVVSEVHRMCGLMRFSEVGPRHGAEGAPTVLYAPMEPDHDIVEFLAEHFCDRYKNDPFIIHDKRRKKALFSAAGEWYITDFEDEGLLAETRGELRYRRLWRDYFDAVAIRERANPECQKRFLPMRYRRNMTEFP